MAAVYQTPGLLGLGLVESFIYWGKDKNYRPMQEEFMQDKLAKGFETFTASESVMDEWTGRFLDSRASVPRSYEKDCKYLRWAFSAGQRKCQCGLE